MWQPKTNIHNIHSTIHLKWAALTFIKFMLEIYVHILSFIKV